MKGKNMKNLLDSLTKEIPLATPQELVEMVMSLQLLEKGVKAGIIKLEENALSTVLDTVALLVHDIVILRRDAGLDMMYDDDALNEKHEKAIEDIKNILQSKDFQDTNTEVVTTDFGVSINKKKEEVN